MNLKPQNVMRHELIGLKAHIVASSDPSHVCREGIIINESKEMIRLETDNGEILLPKQICLLDLEFPDGSIVRIDGQLLRGRPEERMKKHSKRRW